MTGECNDRWVLRAEVTRTIPAVGGLGVTCGRNDPEPVFRPASGANEPASADL